MLKFLTNKLKNHTIDDSPVHQPFYVRVKVDEEKDSGTESDNEQNQFEDSSSVVEMESELSLDASSISTASPLPTVCSIPSPCFLDSVDYDFHNDHHSSEEELEVINAGPKPRRVPISAMTTRPARSVSVNALPEKRKWTEMSLGSSCSDGPVHLETRLCVTPGLHSSGSSDDEVQDLLAVIGAPVQFRTSPPQDVHKPGKSLSPPPKLFHYQVSPRKRHRHLHRTHHLQRPCLDFEKMQQLKARAVTSWRHNGEHGGELSVFCW